MHTTFLNSARACLAAAIICSGMSLADESEELAIQEAYAAWVEAANEKDIAKWSQFLASDPYFVPADSPPLTNTADVIEFYERSFADKWFSLNCEQQYVEVASSGEMAWARGICHATFTGTDGNRASGTSRWFKVWVKHSDGSWRGRVNIWSYVN